MTTPRPRQIKRYGWVPDLPDQRDHVYSAARSADQDLPACVDLRPDCPKGVYEQGKLGSCTANAIAAAIEFDQLQQGIQNFTPSRLFIYYNERVKAGTVESDGGAMLRDGIKSVARQGACMERTWPYEITRFAIEPPPHCYDEALEHRVLAYQRIPRSLTQLRTCLADGHPFVFGFRVYESFESDEVARTGVVTMPDPEEEALGGHAVLAVGYDDASQRFTVRNSWGPEWGDEGYFTMPYDYLAQRGLSGDFWAILRVS